VSVALAVVEVGAVLQGFFDVGACDMTDGGNLTP
jgi:hypothetical protein